MLLDCVGTWQADSRIQHTFSIKRRAAAASWSPERPDDRVVPCPLSREMFDDAALLRRARRDLQGYIALADSRLEQLCAQRRTSADPWGDLAKGVGNDSPAKVPEVVVVEDHPESPVRGYQDSRSRQSRSTRMNG